jgi:hypothetical protein
MFTKPSSQLQRPDLDAVIGAPESERLEFKRDVYGRADDDIREFLKDISSIANASGGFLLVGVDADAEDRATGFPGIANGADEASRMLSSCRVNLEDQILGLEFGLVEVAPARHVLVWGIPRSTRAPHMITFKGLHQFWRRHGRQKARMTIEEIRDACLRVETIRQRLEDFVDGRRKTQLAAIGRREGVMLLSATPLMVRDEVLDTSDRTVRDLLCNPPRSRPNGFGVLRHVNARPTIYGLETKQDVDQIQAFRNGHIEAVVNIAREDRPTRLNPFQVAEVPLNFLLLVSTLMNHLGLQEPVVIGVTIAGIPNWEMQIGMIERGKWEGRRDLELPAMQFAYPLNSGIAAKHIAHRVWNAMGLDTCQLFDDHGNFNPQGIQPI